MTLNLIPGRVRGRHRGKSGLQLQRELADAERRIASLTAGMDQLAAERNDIAGQLDQAQIALGTAGEEIGQLEEAVRLRDQQIEDLKRKVDVGVKAEHVVAQTQEIDPEEVRRICAQSVTGINPPPAVTQVMPLHDSPLASPAHVPAWAKRT